MASAGRRDRFARCRRRWKAVGFATLNQDYASRRKALEALAEDIHPAIQRFADGVDGSVHFVGHSMGGLLARVYIARYRPKRLGRVVMLGTPNSGSEIADRLKTSWRLPRLFGPAGQQLGTQRERGRRRNAATGRLSRRHHRRKSVDLSGGRTMLPKPHDGRVSVANTKLEGMADHVVVADVASVAGAEWACDRADD